MADQEFHRKDYRRKELAILSEEEILTLIAVGSVAFGEPMGDSIRSAWSLGREQIVYQCGVNGYLILDNALKRHGVYYIELVVAHPFGKGIGTMLHEVVFRDVIDSNSHPKTVLVVTQNPSEIATFNKTANKVGYSCFPIDRSASNTERELINWWLKVGPISSLDPAPVVNFDLGLLYNVFRVWLPQTGKVVGGSQLSKFLSTNNIDFDTFQKKGDAFILGFSA